MKKLKLSLFIFVLSLGFANFSHAQETSGAAPEATAPENGVNIEPVAEETTEKTGEIGAEAAKESFQKVYGNSGKDAQGFLNTFPSEIVSYADLVNAFNHLNAAATSCKAYSEDSVLCCTEPDKCGNSGEGVNAKADEAANGVSNQVDQLALAAGAGGGGGAAATCIQALPALLALTARSKGASQSCNMLREGDGNGLLGCSDMCGEIKSKGAELKQIASAMAATGSPDGAQAQMLVPELTKVINIATSAKSSCESKTSGGESKANAQAGTGMNSIMGLFSCVQAVLSGEDPVESLGDADEPTLAANCASEADRAANPGACLGYGGASEYSSNLSKTSGTDLSTLEADPSFDLSDDPNEETPIAATPSADGSGGTSNSKTGAQPGFASLSGSGGSGGVNSKTGRKGSGKGKDLINGYKNTRGGSGSYGGRSPSSHNKFKAFKLSKKKKDKNKNKKALAALSKMMKAGISPDQSGSIFVRASKRFASSSAKEKLFDAKKNISSWMEKKK